MIDKKSIDEIAGKILNWAQSNSIETAFNRAESQKPCPAGKKGACCSICNMGPCRFFDTAGKKTAKGVCGATVDVVAARNFLRMIAAGTAAHSDHGRDLVFTLLEASKNSSDFEIKGRYKLEKIATFLDLEIKDKTSQQLAEQVAEKMLYQFGRQTGKIAFAKRAPAARQKIWDELKITPVGIDREVSEAMHRTNMGVDQEPENIIMGALKTSIADGWGGSMISTEISDVLFGTPQVGFSNVSPGALKKGEVNIIVHGHEPSLAEMMIEVCREDELVNFALNEGAEGINLIGMCCSSNEVLMRHKIPSAGGFLNQELVIMTGLADAICVDVQCIMPSISQVAKAFHTKIITTCDKGKMIDAVHMRFDISNAKKSAKKIAMLAIENFRNRTNKGCRVSDSCPVMAGFSNEFLETTLKELSDSPFRVLNDLIISGDIKGIAGIIGCSHARIVQNSCINFLASELIRNDILIFSTGCAASACARAKLMNPQHAAAMCGAGLKGVYEKLGIPPVLHLGSCVDNSRILTVLTDMVKAGGVGTDLTDLPLVGLAPEWMSEKAIAIGTYLAASGMDVIFGSESPVGASSRVEEFLSKGLKKIVGGSLSFIQEPEEVLRQSLLLIDKKRDALKRIEKRHCQRAA